MSYESPVRETYNWNALAFGGGTLTRKFKGPKGRKGRVIKVDAHATTSFVGTSTPGIVKVGIAGTLTKFATLNMGSAGAGTAAGSGVVANDYASGLVGLVPGAHLLIAADEEVVVTGEAATGGAPAGAADIRVLVEWF